jgi:hypothetical protein
MDELLTRTEAERRDGILRAYVERLDWDLAGEMALRRHLVIESRHLLPDHPLLVGVEWGARAGQAGDLLFFDGERGLLVVELKVIEKNDIAKRLHKVDAQARDFARAARLRFPWATVEGRVYTSVEHAAGAAPRPPRDTRPPAKEFTPQAQGHPLE